MAKKRTPVTVSAVSGDPAVAGLEAKHAKLGADLRIANERLSYLSGELAAMPNDVELEARRLIGEPVAGTDAERLKLVSECNAAEKNVAALSRAMEMLSPVIDAARAAAAERIAATFNRDVITPLAADVSASLAALIENIELLHTAVVVGEQAPVNVALGLHRFREFVNGLNQSAIHWREASAA